MTGGQEGPTELNFKGSGYNHEVLGVLEAKNLSKIGILRSNMAAFERFWPLAPLKPDGRTQNP